MNKRILKKTVRRINLSRQEAILGSLAKHFTITDKRFGNGYFVFTLGENAVCHFHIKETPDWDYGIWLDEDGYFQIFGEHNLLIDKFKPTRTYLSFKNDLDGFVQAVNAIIENPKLHFVASLTYGEALVDFQERMIGSETIYTGYQVKREYNEKTECWDIITRNTDITQESYVNDCYLSFWNERERHLKDEEWDRRYAFNFFKTLPSLYNDIVKVGVIDGNKKGYSCTPRYDLVIAINGKVPSPRSKELFGELNKLINKRNYEGRKTYDHQFELQYITDSISDVKNCDYIFGR